MNSANILNALRFLASKDLVFQIDVQGKTAIAPDGIEELMNNL